MEASEGRSAKGSALLELVKFFKNYEHSNELPALSVATRSLLESRLIGSHWYPLTCLHELLELYNALVIKDDEARALELGAAGGSTLRGVYKAYVVEGDAQSSVLAMRHSWRAHYNFGRIHVETPDHKVVLIQLDDYPDIPMVHALMTAGWSIGAARAAGRQHARCVVLDRPWLGAPHFRYRIEL